MSEHEATARPWETEVHSDGVIEIYGADELITSIPAHLENTEANAALIVRSVNAHADLVAALEAVEWQGHGRGFVLCPSCAQDEISGHTDKCQLAAALAKAKETA